MRWVGSARAAEIDMIRTLCNSKLIFRVTNVQEIRVPQIIEKVLGSTYSLSRHLKQGDKLTYYCSPRSYLERAEICLTHDEVHFLFYAAFELRCFVEARQQQYLEAQESYRLALPGQWKIGKQAAELGRIFGRNDIQRVTYIFPSGDELACKYVPISSKLKSKTEKLGGLLHAQKENLEKGRIDELKSSLFGIYEAANECQDGNMLSPLLLNLDGTAIFTDTTLEIPHDDMEKLHLNFKEGTKMRLNVDYVDFEIDLPE